MSNMEFGSRKYLTILAHANHGSILNRPCVYNNL